ncbi:MAG TPA: hypothetical protein DCE56_11770 [Cyanobacteria bacterium UBA8553]|nr:hypothetical protein [Cyanobacteria bacterium UBA8553]HAJ58584.1 hypothetical protein [Cyanobacteria bacterium UBA8543]
MLSQIWQWLKGLFQRLFGGTTPRGGRSSYRSSQPAYSTQEDTPAPRPLEDSDYEYLFRQLLEGVAHSWQQDRVLRWFEKLKGRITYGEWVAWLRRFGERVLASPAPNNELATRLVLLGEMMLSVPSIQEIGGVAYDIGRQLLSRETGGAVWEYEGPDANATEFSVPFVSPDQAGEPIQPEEAELEAITLDELLVRMQQDPNLLQVIAQQFGLETNDPQMIIQEVINQLAVANQGATEEAETWFTQAIQEHQAGDLEQAIASYDKVLEMRPDAYQAWFNRGNVLVQLGRFEEAIASFDKTLEFQPDLHEAWDHRGDALSSLGRFDEASASYAKAKELETN